MKINRRAFTKAGLGVASLAALGGTQALAGPEHMIRKAIPSSGAMVPLLGLGTNRYGLDTSDAARPTPTPAPGNAATVDSTAPATTAGCTASIPAERVVRKRSVRISPPGLTQLNVFLAVDLKKPATAPKPI